MYRFLVVFSFFNWNCGTALPSLSSQYRRPHSLYMATVADIISNTNTLHTFAQVLREDNLLGLLGGPGPYTVFAPTDAAFDAYQQLLNEIDRDDDILSYHILPGLATKSTLLSLDKKMVKTLNGEEIVVSVDNSASVTVDGSELVGSEVLCDNGVIHFVDKLLLPRFGRQPLPFYPREQAGVCEPLGFFDPLYLCPDDLIGFSKLREAELKHGRVAMLATLGVFVAESGLTFFQDSSPAIYQYQRAAERLNAFSFNLLGFAATVESVNIFLSSRRPPESKSAKDARLQSEFIQGDLRFDPLRLRPNDFSEFREYQTKELNNGRLAMIAIVIIVLYELNTDKAVF